MIMMRRYLTLTLGLGLGLVMGVLAPGTALAARATLAIDPPVVRGGLKAGSNRVTTSIYNEQQLPTPLKRRGGVGATLIVTQPDGTEQTYNAKTRKTRFPGGQPPVKNRVTFNGVQIPAAGDYILTVKVDPDDNPIEYSVSRNRGSQSRTYTVGGGNSIGTGPAAHELIAKIVWRNRRGGGLNVKLFTEQGTLLKRKRTRGDGKTSFKIPAGNYKLEVLRGAKNLQTFDVEMPDEDTIRTFTIE